MSGTKIAGEMTIPPYKICQRAMYYPPKGSIHHTQHWTCLLLPRKRKYYWLLYLWEENQCKSLNEEQIGSNYMLLYGVSLKILVAYNSLKVKKKKT